MLLLDPIVPIYFMYGLAFYTMGFALALQLGDPIGDDVVKRGGGALAAFALVHGSHEWFEMFLIIQTHVYRYEPSLAVQIGRLVALVVSFGALCVAGCHLLCWKIRGRNQRIAPYLFALFLAGMLLIGRRLWPDFEALIVAGDAWARYSLGVTGAVLTGVGLLSRARDYRGSDLRIARGLAVAGAALMLYGLVGQTAAPRSALFPSTVYNTEVFLALAGFPVQVLRAAFAVVATAGLVVALRALHAQRRRALRAAIDAKLAAQALAQEEMARREALQKELLRRTVAAQEDERARIARELHDQTGQTLTALSYRVAALGTGQPVSVSDVQDLQQLAKQALTDLRGLVTDLRPAQLDDLGLVAALYWLADQMRSRIGLNVQVEVRGRKRRLPAEVETSLFRIAQEALTNVARHAGTDAATLCLCFEPEAVRLEVVDAGAGFDFEALHVDDVTLGEDAWGIVGMEERASIIGGQFQLSSMPGQGTTVSVRVPLAGESTDEHEQRDPLAAG